jgi:hypothetical protein
MTNKKIARTPKGRKRPTAKARISPAPHRGAHAETPLPNGLIAMAAARAGITVPEVVAALKEPADAADPRIPPPLSREDRIAGEERDRVTAAIGPRLRRISDIIAERVAVASDNLDFEVMHDLAEALSDVWHIRWELGVLNTRQDDDEACERAAGGAS